MGNSLKYQDVTEKIIGACYDVHDFLGIGYPEVIYQRALAIELGVRGLSVQREVTVDIHYKDFGSIGLRKIDILVDYKIILETKAIGNLEAADFVQVLNYLKVFQLEVGLLVNFGSKDLQFKRLILDR